MRGPGGNHLFLQHELSFLEPQVDLEKENKFLLGKSRFMAEEKDWHINNI